MRNIFARSPFIVEINEVGQTSTKVELFIWNNGTSTPTSPTYTLSKLIPSSNEPATKYNVSNYINEFITFNDDGSYVSIKTNTGNKPNEQYANVIIKRYKNIGAGDVLIDSTTYLAFGGYTYYENGSNYDYGDIHLDSGTYEYYNDGLGVLGNLDYTRALTNVTVMEDGLVLTANYTNLDTLATFSEPILATVSAVPLIYKNYYGYRCKLEIKDASNNILATYTTIPKTACKYTPVRCDFVNRFGSFQRIWFYAASNESINVTSNEYKLLQSSITDYNTKQGQKREFNINGQKTIKVNSDWVDEDFKNVIKEILLSEKILINDLPAKVKTKSVELFNNINTKQINYALEFEFNHNLINDVI